VISVRMIPASMKKCVPPAIVPALLGFAPKRLFKNNFSISGTITLPPAVTSTREVSDDAKDR
jgi:hypothetical protein